MHKTIVRMLSPLAAALFSLVMSLSAHAAAPTLSSPANNATVQLQNATQKTYFAKTPRADRWAYMDSDTGRKAMIAATSRPEPVTFSWSGGTAPYTLTVKRVSDGATFALENNISTTSIKLYNFEIGRKYSWTVKEKGGAVSATRTFTTETDAPRFLRVGLANKDTFSASLTRSSGEGSAKANGSDFLPNFRDLGGVFTADRTQRMKQGLVFRSYEYDKYGSEWKPYGVDTDLVCGTGPGQLGIKTDLDLRSDAEVAAIVNTNNGKSPLNTTAHPVSWQHCAIAKYDAAQLGTPEKNALALIADASKYPLVFHCMCGQDRTGCLAIYIYSILGVDDETMLKSWEASSFFQGDNNWSDSDPGFRSYRIQGFIDSFRAYGTSSDTLAACVVKALKAKNVVTDTTIAQIRANLLETDEFCDEPTPSDDPLPSAFDAAHTIVCWGDSLTFGRTAEASGETTNLGTLNNYFGGRLNGKSVAKSYPYYLAQQVDSSYNVIAQARSGMCADMILAWMGGTETKTTKSITVQKTGTVAVQNGFTFPGRPNDGRGTIAVSESSTFAGLVAPVYALHSTAIELGASKIDKVITGRLGGTRVAVTGDDSTALTVKSLDTLSAAVTVAAGTTFVPDATRAPYRDAVHVIFVGTNDGAGNYSDVIAQVQNAVAKIPSGRYVVVSTHAADKNAQTGETLTPTAASTLERAYAEAFGNRHLNLRLALYAKDATWETDGKLASDDLHFTPAGYQLVAEIVKAKLDALGYLGGTPGPGPEPVTYEKTVSVDETVTKLDITTSGTLTLNNAKLTVTDKVSKYDAVPLPNGLAADLTVKFIGANAALEYTGESSWLAPGYPTNGLAAFTGSCTLDYTVPASGWRSAATAPLRAVGATDRVYFGKNVKFVIDATAVQPSAGETVKIYLASGTHAEGGVHFSDGYGFDVIKAASTVTVSTGMTYVFAAEQDAIVLSVTAPGTPTEKKGFERAKQENRPPRVLVIGNSFTQGVSRDLQYNGQTIKEYRTHFPTAVRAMGETIDYCALYRGGSSIQQHYEHRETKGFFAEIDWSFDSAAPSWARNGEKKGMFWCDEDGKTKDNRESETPPSDTTPYHICLDDLLNAVDWDVIMIQESAEIVPFWNAPESEWIGVNTPECRRDYETGTPRVSYGEPLANYVAYLKAKRPNAELWLHQTWALPAETPCIDLGTKEKRDWMYNAINTNAMRVAALYGTKTVPTGYAVQLYRYQYSDSHNPEVTDPCSYDLRHINGGYSIYAEKQIPAEQRYRTYLQMMTWCQRWYGKMPAVGTTPCEPSVAAELTAMRAAALQAGNATEYWDYGQGGDKPAEVVRTVSTDTTEANLVFDGTSGKLILDNATLTVSGKLSNYVAYRFGEDATGALELSFAGAKAGLVHEQKSTAGMIGSTTATSEMLVRFTVPATPWTVAPLRTTATDSKIYFRKNVKFAVDATAVANPGAGVTVTVPLAAGTAIDDDGVTPVGVSFDGVDFATVKARSIVTCADGVTGELVYENAALFVRLTGSGDTPTPESPITLTAPANGSTLALYTANQKKYFALTGEAIKTQFTDFDESMMDSYLKIKATFMWSGASGAVTLKIVRAADQVPFLTKSLASGTKSLVVNNLEVGTAYTWSVEDAAGNRQTATFTTEAQAPRILYSQKVKSVRDLGGWTGLQGCRVKQGELIRTAEMDNYGAENRLSDDEMAFYRDVIGVRSDVDLRSNVTIRDEETQSVETTGRTPIPGATWYGCPVTGFGYQFPEPSEVAQLNTNFANFKKAFGYVLDAAKRPLVFHCISGRDRTGTVAALTLALLGVSEDDIWREYRIAQDMTSADRFHIDEITGTLKTRYPAATLAASAKRYFTETLGFMSAEVEQFRAAMLPGYEPEDPPVSTLALTAPADGATVALYTADQKKYFALTGEAIKTQYTGFDSSMRDRYLHPSVTLAWTGANGAVTVRVTRQGGRVLVSKELAAGTASLAVYNLEVGATYTWTVTDAEGASSSASFTTEAQAPRILNGDQIPSVRDLGGWVGLQGIRVKQGELVRTAHLDDEGTGASLLTDTSRDTFLNVIGVKTELDFRSSTELAKIGRDSTSKLGATVTRYCYPIPSYALGDFVPGEDKPYGYFALAFQRVFDSGSRPLAFHCKIGRDRTGTFAAMILSLLGVSEDDIMREYRIAGDFSTSSYFHIDEVIALLKTEFPADTLAASAKRYFTEAVGFTADEVEQFRAEMLPGYDREDPTPGEYVRTVSSNTTEEHLVFEGTAGRLVLDNATLTVSGTEVQYVAYRFGENATGALSLEFAGANAGLVHSTAASAGLIGSTTATSDMLVKFTVPATPWTVAPLRATATDSKIYFRKNVKFAVDAKAVVNPGPGETISVPLASGTAIDDDGVTPVGVLFDGVDFETVKQRSTVTCGDGVTGELVYEGSALVLVLTGSGDVPKATYYLVGADAAGASSFAKSSGTDVGWAETEGGTVLPSHTVSSDNDYVVPTGSILRTPAGTSPVTFAGGSLTLNFSILWKGSKTVTIPDLRIGAGTIQAGDRNLSATLAGQTTIPEGKTLHLKMFRDDNSTGATWTLNTKIVGAGSIRVAGDSTTGATPTGRQTLIIADAADFTGNLYAQNQANPQNFVLKVTGGFGGTVTSLPNGTEKVIFNYDGLDAAKGVVVADAATAVPEGLTTGLVLYSATADFTAANLPLITFPSGAAVDVTDFTVSHAASADGAAVAFGGLGMVKNADGTKTLVANSVLNPGEGVDEVEVTANGQTAAEDMVAIVSPDETIVSSEVYVGYFTKRAVSVPGAANRWVVSAALKEEVVKPEPVAADLAGKFGEIAEGIVTITGAKPGLWYSVKEGNTLGEELVEGPRAQAAADGTVALKVTKFPTSGFYRVVVGATGKVE